MQTLIQVFSREPQSLRTRVVDDPNLGKFGLIVTARRKKGRPKGWAKLSMSGSDGVINIEWHAASQTLICRVVTKGGEPHDISGAFIRFLLAQLSEQIASIRIQPQN